MSATNTGKTSSSPRRSAVTREVKMNRFSSHMMEQRENVDLHMDLKRSRAEEEHLKNLLIGLNEKLAVYVDLKRDLEQNKNMLSQSEGAREDLQATIHEIADKVKEDAEQHQMHANTLTKEIADLKQQINAMEQKAAEVKQAHLREMDLKSQSMAA
jgi:chromosome segregation ATPase